MAAGRLILKLYAQCPGAKPLFDRHLRVLLYITSYCRQ